jgi:glycerophosphoryl diester phosphodiesterase
MCPIPSQYYKINFKMMWPTLPAVTEHSGIAFGKADDQVYAFGIVAATNGYHLVFRGDGDMQIYKHTAGSGSGTQLGDLQNTLPAPSAGTWMEFEIEVNATQVIARRLDTPGAPSVLTVANVENRPALPYFHLSTGSVTNAAAAPHFKDIAITAL